MDIRTWFWLAALGLWISIGVVRRHVLLGRLHEFGRVASLAWYFLLWVAMVVGSAPH